MATSERYIDVDGHILEPGGFDPHERILWSYHYPHSDSVTEPVKKLGAKLYAARTRTGRLLIRG